MIGVGTTLWLPALSGLGPSATSIIAENNGLLFTSKAGVYTFEREAVAGDPVLAWKDQITETGPNVAVTPTVVDSSVWADLGGGSYAFNRGSDNGYLRFDISGVEESAVYQLDFDLIFGEGTTTSPKLRCQFNGSAYGAVTEDATYSYFTTTTNDTVFVQFLITQEGSVGVISNIQLRKVVASLQTDTASQPEMTASGIGYDGLDDYARLTNDGRFSASSFTVALRGVIRDFSTQSAAINLGETAYEAIMCSQNSGTLNTRISDGTYIDVGTPVAGEPFTLVWRGTWGGNTSVSFNGVFGDTYTSTASGGNDLILASRRSTFSFLPCPLDVHAIAAAPALLSDEEVSAVSKYLEGL